MKKASSFLTILKNTICAVLVLLVLLAVPTGWLYDLWAGTGTEQGQQPSGDVRQLQRQEEIETFFLSNTPATVSGGTLAACPLARLRDASQEGVHTHQSGMGKSSVYVSEYIYADHPVPPFQRFLQGLVGGYYNRYYLIELPDGSWLCAYFDDYLIWTETDNYPTGYVRYTTTEERRMLNRMAEDYAVDPVYVLDLYRYGKAGWMLDVLLRLAVCLAAAGIVWCVKGLWGKIFRKRTETP